MAPWCVGGCSQFKKGGKTIGPHTLYVYTQTQTSQHRHTRAQPSLLTVGPGQEGDGAGDGDGLVGDDGGHALHVRGQVPVRQLHALGGAWVGRGEGLLEWELVEEGEEGHLFDACSGCMHASVVGSILRPPISRCDSPVVPLV